MWHICHWVYEDDRMMPGVITDLSLLLLLYILTVFSCRKFLFSCQTNIQPVGIMTLKGDFTLTRVSCSPGDNTTTAWEEIFRLTQWLTGSSISSKRFLKHLLLQRITSDLINMTACHVVGGSGLDKCNPQWRTLPSQEINLPLTVMLMERDIWKDLHHA